LIQNNLVFSTRPYDYAALAAEFGNGLCDDTDNDAALEAEFRYDVDYESQGE